MWVRLWPHLVCQQGDTTLCIKTFGIITLGIITLSIMTLSITFKNCETQHNGTQYWALLCSGMYYKHINIVNDDSSFVSKWSLKLTDDPRIVIYDRHKFIMQATARTKFNKVSNFSFVRRQLKLWRNGSLRQRVACSGLVPGARQDVHLRGGDRNRIGPGSDVSSGLLYVGPHRRASAQVGFWG